jgi:hypothetical protein
MSGQNQPEWLRLSGSAITSVSSSSCRRVIATNDRFGATKARNSRVRRTRPGCETSGWGTWPRSSRLSTPS